MNMFSAEDFYTKHLGNATARDFQFYCDVIFKLKEYLKRNEIKLSDNENYNGFLFGFGARAEDGTLFDLSKKTTIILTINPAGKQKEGPYPEDYLGETDIKTHLEDNDSTIANQLHHLYSAIYNIDKLSSQYNGEKYKLDDSAFIGYCTENIIESTFLTFRTENYRKFIFSDKNKPVNKEIKKEITNFFNMLWEDIILHAENLKRIIVLGCHPYNNITNVLMGKKLGFQIVQDKNNPRELKSGWGKATISFSKFEKGKSLLTVGRLPHLSYYKLFSRDNCRKPINDFLKKMFCK